MKTLNSLVVFIVLSIASTAQAQDEIFDICPLKVGEMVPGHVKLYSADGDSTSLGFEVVNRKTILVFYRGGWCPYCIRHLSALHEIKDEIEDLGYDLIAITPDQFDSLGATEAKAEVDFTIYSDSKAEAIEAFGLGWRMNDELYKKFVEAYDLDITEWSGNNHRILPAPALYVIEDGMVIFQYVNPNYQVRIKPETLLAVLKTL